MMRPLMVLVLLSCAPAASASADLDAAFSRTAIVIASGRACYRFDVWLAVDPGQRARGLMHVRELGPWQGMLFVYDGEAQHSMWMKNTLIPLDMLFIRGDGTVSSIVRDTEPQSLTSIASTEPVRFVLELNGGVSERLGLAAGDTLIRNGDAAKASENGGD